MRARTRRMLRVAVAAINTKRGRPCWITRGPVNAIARGVPVVVSAATRRPCTRRRGLRRNHVPYTQVAYRQPAQVADRPATLALASGLEPQPERDAVVRSPRTREPLPVAGRPENLRGARTIGHAADGGDILEPAGELMHSGSPRRQPGITRLPRRSRSRRRERSHPNASKDYENDQAPHHGPLSPTTPTCLPWSISVPLTRPRSSTVSAGAPSSAFFGAPT
jgi:hypothetical protein